MLYDSPSFQYVWQSVLRFSADCRAGLQHDLEAKQSPFPSVFSLRDCKLSKCLAIRGSLAMKKGNFYMRLHSLISTTTLFTNLERSSEEQKYVYKNTAVLP